MLIASVDPPRFARRIDAGFVTLDVVLHGAPDERAQDYFDGLLSAHHATPDSPADVVRCTFHGLGRTQCDTLAPARTTPNATAIGADTWYVEWPFYRGVFQPDRADVAVSGLRGGLEHATRAALVFSSLPARGLAFHAATLRFGDEVVMVCGASGAGKSTISREGGADGVLTDEFSLVAPVGGGWTALPSPIWGFGGVAHKDRRGTLSAIAVLTNRRDATRWRQVHGASALAALSPHLGFQSPAQIARPDALKQLTALASSLPVYELDWLRGTHLLADAPWKRST